MAKLTKLITLFGVCVLLSATAYAGGYNHDDDDDDDHDGGKGGGGKGRKRLCRRGPAMIPSPLRFPNEKYLCCPDDHFLYKLEDKEERNGRAYSEFANVDRVTCGRFFCDGDVVSVNKQEVQKIEPHMYGKEMYGSDDYDKYRMKCPPSPYNGKTRVITGFKHDLNGDLDDATTTVKGFVCADVDGGKVDTHDCAAIPVGMDRDAIHASRTEFQNEHWPIGLRVCPDEKALVALAEYGPPFDIEWALCCSIVEDKH